VPTTFHPLFRNSAAMAWPRPREAPIRSIVGAVSFKMAGGMGAVSFADGLTMNMSNPNDWRQTHLLQDIVAPDARFGHFDRLGSASWTMST
jgi:hypothetical protein